jgi:prepilin-type N-terminal cleavage/methylation domain-containing protein
MDKKGFTLIELVIVVVIIGILSSIAAIKYADLLTKANEGALRGNLGSIRSALSIYYSNLDGQYPQDLTSLTANSTYLRSLPAATVPGRHNSNAVTLGTAAADGAGWLYDNVALDSHFGGVWVNCTHNDTKGTAWNAY